MARHPSAQTYCCDRGRIRDLVPAEFGHFRCIFCLAQRPWGVWNGSFPSPHESWMEVAWGRPRCFVCWRHVSDPRIHPPAQEDVVLYTRDWYLRRGFFIKLAYDGWFIMGIDEDMPFMEAHVLADQRMIVSSMATYDAIGHEGMQRAHRHVGRVNLVHENLHLYQSYMRGFSKVTELEEA